MPGRIPTERQAEALAEVMANLQTYYDGQHVNLKASIVWGKHALSERAVRLVRQLHGRRHPRHVAHHPRRVPTPRDVLGQIHVAWPVAVHRPILKPDLHLA